MPPLISTKFIKAQIAVGHCEHPLAREFPVRIEQRDFILITREQIENDMPRITYDFFYLTEVDPLVPLPIYNVIGLDSTRGIGPTNNFASGLTIMNCELARADSWMVDARHCVRPFEIQ